MKKSNILQNVLNLESQALLEASEKITNEQILSLEVFFKKLVENKSTLFFSGVGKSGFIAQKLASTFSSIGLPSFFIHPVEALHGDLGRFRNNDGLVIISKSGTTAELEKFIPFVKTPKENIIGLLGNTKASLAASCGLIFDCSVKQEACINNLAPTTSSTLAMALGDSLAVFWEYFTGLDKYSFALNHPGGLLGKSLSLKVSNLMIELENCPTAKLNQSLKDILLLMTDNPLGACAIIDKDKMLIGLIVEGDIRRTLMSNHLNLDLSVDQIMNSKPITIKENELAISALNLMEKRKNPIYVLPVIGENNQFKGLIRMHDLIKEGLK